MRIKIRISLLLLFLVSVGLTASAFACAPIPYCNVGQIAPANSLTAFATGDLMGSYYGHIADFTDWVRVIDVTSNMTGAWVFNNQTSKPGDKADFGFVTKGDTLVVEIWDQNTGHIFASDPSFSDDQTNHAYVFPGFYVNPTTPVVFFGMEDLQANEQTDWDYNDSEFFLYNVLASQDNTLGRNGINVANPEPSTMALLGTGLLAGLARLRKSKR